MMKVLLVEDSPLLRERVMESIAEFSNIVVEDYAETQEQAISLLDSKPYDILIADIELAKGNGFEVIKHTQSVNFKYRVPTYFVLTNHVYPHYRKYAKELGVHYFYDKSMDFEDAIAAIGQEAAAHE
jgi:DNA-binding NarL/FixJ family response regulator